MCKNKTKLAKIGLRVDQGSKGSRGRPTGSQEVKALVYRVLGGRGVGLQCPMGSRVRPTGSQGVKG